MARKPVDKKDTIAQCAGVKNCRRIVGESESSNRGGTGILERVQTLKQETAESLAVSRGDPPARGRSDSALIGSEVLPGALSRRLPGVV